MQVLFRFPRFSIHSIWWIFNGATHSWLVHVSWYNRSFYGIMFFSSVTLVFFHFTSLYMLTACLKGGGVMAIGHDTSFSLLCTFLSIHIPLTYLFPSLTFVLPPLTFLVVYLWLSRRGCVGTRCMHERRRWKRQIYIVLFLCVWGGMCTHSSFVFDVCLFLG
jgi:hypothetical protein